MDILTAGGSGFIGRALVKKLGKSGHRVFLLTRKRFQSCDGYKKVLHWNGTDFDCDIRFNAIINLCGENIANKRWSKRQKLKLLNSRTKSTRALFNGLKRQKSEIYKNCQLPLLLNASAIGFYNSSALKQDELNYSSPVDDTFTQQLVSAWEHEASSFRTIGMSVSCLRFGVVLGRNGGMLKKMLPSFRMGFGSIMGCGGSFLSWIHIHDLCRSIEHILSQPDPQPVYNITAPEPCTQQVFSDKLSKVLHRPRFLKIPPWLIKLLFGEMGEALMLSDHQILPRQLLDDGFSFNYPNISTALSHIIKGKS